jgi:hypothetical protein
MNPKVIALFGVSVTAGSCYVAYILLKGHTITQLIKSWKEAADKKQKTIDETKLKTELDKLSLSDVRLVGRISAAYLKGADQAVMTALASKARARDLFQKAKLDSVAGVGIPH